MSVVVKLENIHKSFGNTDVLRGISLDVHHGEVVALIGASGSGKFNAPPMRQSFGTDRRWTDLAGRR